MPIVVDGQLVNYVFVYVRINLKSGADVTKMREKEPFFRDALVRDGAPHALRASPATGRRSTSASWWPP